MINAMQKFNDIGYDSFQNATLLILRLIVAAIFLYAGIAKWSFWSSSIAGMSDTVINLIRFLSIVEPLGALGFIVGFLTRWAAAGFSLIMIGAIVYLSSSGVSFFTQPQATGWDYNLLLLGASLAVLVFGAGKWSLDYRRK